MSESPCPECQGRRLRKESLAVKVADKDIAQLTALSIQDAKQFFSQIKLPQDKKIISAEILKEINRRLDFCINVGLEYLELDRKSSTLSGGEAERIRLATQVGSGLVGVIYVLDEPSIGLHHKDNDRLLSTLHALRDLGNTLIVVEHDEDTIRRADYVIDLGPGAGENGGHVIYAGAVEGLMQCRESLTGQYLTGDFQIQRPDKPRDIVNTPFLKIIGAAQHNLKDLDVSIPLGTFICVTGVSGSGKSTLVTDILYKALVHKIYGSKEKPGRVKRIEGIQHIDKVIVVDQSPIGRTPRSIQRPIQVYLVIFVIYLQNCPNLNCGDISPGGLVLTSKAGVVRLVKAMGLKKLKCTFCRMFMWSAKFATAGDLQTRPFRCSINPEILLMCLSFL